MILSKAQPEDIENNIILHYYVVEEVGYALSKIL